MPKKVDDVPPGYIRVPSIGEVDGIAVFCDSHRNRVLVNKFQHKQDSDRRWAEWRDTGESVVSERDGSESIQHGLVSAPRELPMPDSSNKDEGPPWPMTSFTLNKHLAGRVRARYNLRCRRCKKSVVVREEKLFTALDAIAATGASETSLRGLAAIVSRID